MKSGRGGPRRMCIGSEGAEGFAADEVTFGVKGIVDGGVRREKSLG